MPCWRMAKSRLLQFELNERTWSVLATTPELAPQLDGCEGLCVFEHNLILVDSTLPRDTQQQALVHELIHAVLHESGAGVVLLKLLEVNPELWGDFEETFVRLLAPMLSQTPVIKFPRGWVELGLAEARAFAKGKF